MITLMFMALWHAPRPSPEPLCYRMAEYQSIVICGDGFVLPQKACWDFGEAQQTFVISTDSFILFPMTNGDIDLPARLVVSP